MSTALFIVFCLIMIIGIITFFGLVLEVPFILTLSIIIVAIIIAMTTIGPTIPEESLVKTINVTGDLVDAKDTEQWNGKFYSSVNADRYYIRDDKGDIYKTDSLNSFNILNKKGQHIISVYMFEKYSIKEVFS